MSTSIFSQGGRARRIRLGLSSGALGFAGPALSGILGVPALRRLSL